MKTITLSRDYSVYTEEQHFAWNKLYNRQLSILKGRACKEFIEGVEMLKELIQPLPKLEILSVRLQEFVGWKLVPVRGMIKSQEYYMYLANKQFPVAVDIRDTKNDGFSPLPDVWHDIFGHLPLLTSPLYSNFVEDIAKLWLTKNEIQKQQIANIYWYTIESGICQENGERRVYGASQLSSFDEIHYALNDQAKVYSFDLQSLIHANIRHDEFQNKLFEIPAFDYLEQILDELKFV
ncbi:hypothetical protein I8751_08010 [Nostocaceae cyanobacterium CENA357]|uniref:Biopterin-dependent aromatic amino acid hydroxylase family profile domain-containing protein n=1 Tax=Atlanticothrix silvestris CENA357 TaxID=1725252 RepID=A0A8J7HH89_9CYAN|nr:hypothetical protein [Atlanticothrix silvestris]MBH8552318.1 hypothetical protein [Atlanticothrix silvestris CENA357]